ncbi:MAG: hypothetical protein ACRETP_03145, partial [Steroidobacteraceae bacterium]
VRFWFEVLGWVLRSGWSLFQRLPRWVRIILIIWLAVILLSKGCTPGSHRSADLSPATARKLAAISDQYQGSSNKAHVERLAAQVASAFTADPAKIAAEVNSKLPSRAEHY